MTEVEAREVMKNVRDYGTLNDLEVEALDVILTREEELEKENERLRDLYWRTARRLNENGKVELADYMLAQIHAVPTFIPM